MPGKIYILLFLKTSENVGTIIILPRQVGKGGLRLAK